MLCHSVDPIDDDDDDSKMCKKMKNPYQNHLLQTANVVIPATMTTTTRGLREISTSPNSECPRTGSTDRITPLARSFGSLAARICDRASSSVGTSFDMADVHIFIANGSYPSAPRQQQLLSGASFNAATV